jgi:hypothetical protein
VPKLPVPVGGPEKLPFANGQEFVHAAVSAGFQVLMELPAPPWSSAKPGITLVGTTPAQPAPSVGLEDFYQTALILLYRVPRRHGRYDYQDYPFVVTQPHTLGLRLGIDQVDSYFYEQVQAALDRIASRDDERAQLDRDFNAKVGEEIAADPKIIELEDALTAAQRQLHFIQAARSRREHELRQESEGVRSAYRYVADEKEL